MKVDGKVIRAFISNPSAQLLKFVSDAKNRAHDMVGKLLQHFWKTQGAVPVLQIRTNYTITTDKVSGKALYVPSGMYFDILMKEIPPFWPSNFPASHGNLRWFVTGAKVTDFAKTQAPTKQPAGRFHSALANWFKASSHTTLPALAAPGEIPPQSAAALAMPRSRRGGERGARQREKQHEQWSGRPQAETPCQFGNVCRNHKAGTCKFYHGPPLEAGQVPEPAWQLVKKKGGGKAPMLPPTAASGRFPVAPTVPQANPYAAKRPCRDGTASGSPTRQRTEASGSTPFVEDVTGADLMSDLC